MTLTEFLLARIAEDEAAARAAGATIVTDHRGSHARIDRPMNGLPSVTLSPARMLAECESKRGAIEAAWVDWCQIVNEFGNGGDRDELSAQHDNPAVLCHLALPHADHPDYREEWKP